MGSIMVTCSVRKLLWVSKAFYNIVNLHKQYEFQNAQKQVKQP